LPRAIARAPRSSQATCRSTGPQVLAWPKEPKTNVVRNGSRLNQVLLLRLNPDSLDDQTLPRAANGIVAYSAICTHAQCPVTGWVDEGGAY
jgi:rieske iron-sulfur protein